MKKFAVAMGILVILGIGAGAARMFLNGGEDTWICEKGEWIKHGQPSRAKPTTGCGENDQKFLTFETNDFYIKYPNWGPITKYANTELQFLKAAVTKNDCDVVIMDNVLDKKMTITQYADKMMAAIAGEKKINKKEITQDRAYVDAQVATNGATMKMVSLAVAAKSNSYEVVFMAPAEKFEGSCGSVFNEVIGSVKTK